MLKWLKDWLFPPEPAPMPMASAAPSPTDRPPVVGVSGANSDSASVRAMMTQIRDMGAVPMFLGNHSQRSAALDIKKIDALVVMGNSGDINPARYGETPHPKTHIEEDKAREEYEFAMLEAAINQKMPVLGVCGGMQRINVLLGGSLHQHVPDVVPDANYTAQQDAGIPPFCPVEAIHLEQGTRLSQLAKGTQSLYMPLQKPGNDRLVEGGYVMENSMHHQAVNRLGQGMRIAATSYGMLPEAIEPHPAGPFARQFLLGVQWHPEFGASPLGPHIAESLNKAAEAYAHANGRAHPMHQAVEESLFSSVPSMLQRQQQTAALRFQP